MVDEFRIAIADSDLSDLESRLEAARRPTGVTEDGGIALVDVDALIRYWLEVFDWRAQEASLNLLPQFLGDIADARVHFVHARNSRASALPLLLLHGWPGSFVEMRHIISRLATDFHVIVPSLPGYGFSTLPGPGYSKAHVADLMAGLMSVLGYEEFGVQGGDWGAGVGTWLTLKYPHRVTGLHLNYIPGSFRPFVNGDPTDIERAFLRSNGRMDDTVGCVRTRPAHPSADTRLWPQRLASRSSGVDLREIHGVVRPKHAPERRRHSHEHFPVLVHQHDRVICPTVSGICSDAPAL